MIIYLYGKDSYRRKEKLRDLLETYEEKHENQDVAEFDFSSDEESWKDVKYFLKQPSMFQDSKVSVIKEGTSVRKSEWVSILKDYLETEDVFILISEDRKKPVKKFSFLLDSPVKSQKFEELEGDKLKRFLNKKIKEFGLRLSKKAWKFIFSYLKESDHRSWRAVNELKKIDLAGFDNPVSLEEVQSLISWTPREKMFNETKKLFGKSSLLDKVEVLESLLIREESNSHVFNLLGYQSKGSRAEKLSELDVKIKSGKLEYEEALLEFALD